MRPEQKLVNVLKHYLQASEAAIALLQEGHRAPGSLGVKEARGTGTSDLQDLGDRTTPALPSGALGLARLFHSLS